MKESVMEVTEDFDDLPDEVAGAMAEIKRHPIFSFERGSEQFRVVLDGDAIGGWNMNKRHFYVFQSFEERFQIENLLKDRGFIKESRPKGNAHYWVLKGSAGASEFEQVILAGSGLR